MNATPAHRKFFELPENVPDPVGFAVQGEPEHSEGTRAGLEAPAAEESVQEGGLFSYIEQNVVGKDKVFSGPFGLRKVEYCDYTASGRSLSFIEDYISQEVLPDYGNTHTTTTVTSLQTTLFRHEARDIIRNAVHASEHDAVIFVGSGCTGAVHKLIHSLHLQEPPVVFVGPYEHHSNLLPWKEIGAAVVPIRETTEGLVDKQHLRDELEQWKGGGHTMIGCFAAASNVTGVLADTDSITILLHRYGAIVFWDYATAGAYVSIDMNPVVQSSEDQQYAYKDAIFISPHKFVGGVQTPGVLVAKKALFKNPVPEGCGGGTVFFVRRSGQRYLQETEMKEEGGTPAIVESIRAGLVFQLKEAVTAQAILEREHKFTRLAFKEWSDVPSLVLLGPTKVPRLAIFSFLIKHQGTGLFLHHNFICTILNDVFGIQARGGCACAGPYAEDLLGIDEELAIRIENMLVEDSRLDRVHLRRYREYSDREILRPGFVRLNLPYFASEESVKFVLEAVKMVADHGWKLLPQYTFNPETGEWRHRNHQVFKDRKWLGFISYKSGSMTYREPTCVEKGPLPETYKDCLRDAEMLFDQAKKVRVHIADQTIMFTEEADDLRWFLLPSEALPWLQQNSSTFSKEPRKVPFNPVSYPKIEDKTKALSSPSDYTHCFKKVSNGILKQDSNKTLNSESRGQSARKSQHKPSPANVLREGRTQRKGLLKRGRSEERAITKTASLADGLLSALKEIEKDLGAGDFMEGLKNTLSQGYAPEGELDSLSEIKEDPAIPSIGKVTFSSSSHLGDMNDGLGSKKASINSAANIRSIYFSKKEDEDSQKVAEEPKNNGSGNPGFICENGTCFKKREKSDNTSTPTPPGKQKWHPPPKKIFNPAVEALEEFSMIQDGDRVLVCLSGGKDSLSLLHMLRQYKFYAKKKGISFELGAVTIDPMTSSYDPSPLKGYLAQLGVPYFYEEQAILEAAASLPYEVTSICSFCSRMKRGRIYHAARRENYNVLAMGQHLDDLAESFLMSVFHNGLLRTMKACYTVQEGDLRLVRPFVYVREKDLRQFAEERKLPIIPENCPACFEAPKERHRMKQLLASQEVIFPRLFHSIQAAIKPILSINKTGINVNKLFEQMNGEEDEDKELEGL